MVTKIRNWSLAVITISVCLMGLIGPIIYPEYFIQTSWQMNYTPAL